jgi:tripartite-type tricarboxylate transporter receptor subunit TctC
MTLDAFRVRNATLVITALLLMIGPACAQGVADFYRGKSINMIVGFNPGGGADAYARLVGRHISRYLPGNPTVVLRHMQGAGSVIGANYVFNVSPKDGSEIGLFAGNIIIDPLIGGTQHKYDARAFNWIGSPASDSQICLSSGKSSFKTMDDVFKREMIVGTAGTSTIDFPLTMNNVLGTKLKIIRGYAGSAAIRLALERGEIESICGVGYSSMRTAGLLEPGRMNILVQFGMTKSPKMPDVPFIFDYAKTSEDRQLLTLIFGWLGLERPIAAPPGTPADRVQALRDAFDKAITDPALLAEAEKANVEINAMSGAAIAKFVEEVSQTPASVTARAARVLERSKK